jgi:hypothetical protein
MAPEGTDILKAPIARLYPSDDPAHYVPGNMSRYVYKCVGHTEPVIRYILFTDRH